MYSIGKISGAIWNYLNKEGKSQYKKVKDSVLEEFTDLPMKEQRFSMAVGWLAREEKINFFEEGNGRRYRLYLELK